MQVSESFKAVQRRMFQDKLVSLRPAEVNNGTYGSAIITPGPVSGTARVNFQILSDQLVPAELGLQVGQDALMTSSDPVTIGKGDYVQYDGAVYLIVETPRFDSHFKWLLKATGEAVV